MFSFLFRNRRTIETVLRVVAFAITIVIETAIAIRNYARNQFNPAQ